MSKGRSQLTLAEVCSAGRFAWKGDLLFAQGRIFRPSRQRDGARPEPQAGPEFVYEADWQIFQGWEHLPDCDCRYCLKEGDDDQQVGARS